MRLEQTPWPGGAARCSSGMSSVLELEGRGPELSVHSWHTCDDQLQLDSEMCLCYLPWRKAWIRQLQKTLCNWWQVHAQKMWRAKTDLEMPSNTKNHKAFSALKYESWQSKSPVCLTLPLSSSLIHFSSFKTEV